MEHNKIVTNVQKAPKRYEKSVGYVDKNVNM